VTVADGVGTTDLLALNVISTRYPWKIPLFVMWTIPSS